MALIKRKTLATLIATLEDISVGCTTDCRKKCSPISDQKDTRFDFFSKQEGKGNHIGSSCLEL